MSQPCCAPRDSRLRDPSQPPPERMESCPPWEARWDTWVSSEPPEGNHQQRGPVGPACSGGKGSPLGRSPGGVTLQGSSG